MIVAKMKLIILNENADCGEQLYQIKKLRDILQQIMIKEGNQWKR